MSSLGKYMRVFLFSTVFLFVPFLATAATYVVNSPLDTLDGSCSSTYVNENTDCTLRDAITASNASTTVDDTIEFAIDASFSSNPATYADGQYILPVSSHLPYVTDAVIISGAGMWNDTQERPGIRLIDTTASLYGMTILAAGSGSQISGLEFEGFMYAVRLYGTDTMVGTNCDGVTDTKERNIVHGAKTAVFIAGSNNVVAGNYMSLYADGVTYAPNTAYNIFITGPNADGNSIGFRESQTCTAEQQRNVVAGTSGSNPSIYIVGTGAVKLAGDATLAPDHNRVSGNYIGTDVSGMEALPGSGNALNLNLNPTLNLIGTDGDGVEDAKERNLITSASIGVLNLGSGYNRISGNYIGVNATGNAVLDGVSDVFGVILRGQGIIAGWCDTSIHAELCSDAGNIDSQRNVIGGASKDAIRFGVDSYQASIYGNYLGVGADGITPIPNEEGFFVHRASRDNIFGGPGVKANVVRFNTIGIKLDGEYVGNSGKGLYQEPITNIVIDNNSITDNTDTGILNYWTENFDTNPGPNDATITNNTIQNNGGVGIDVWGSSPLIQNNLIDSNGTYGVYVHPAFLKRDSINEAVESYDPADAATNLVSQPQIVGNTISNNGSYGVYQLDSRASNFASLYTDNTFSGAAEAIQQQWYGLVEVVDKEGNPIASGAWANVTPTLVNAFGAPTLLNAYAAAETTHVVYGTTTVDYTDIRTWMVMTEYYQSVAGAYTDMGPYRATTTTHDKFMNTRGTEYTFDGNNNDAPYGNGLPSGIDTQGVYRFQIATLYTSSRPDRPTLIDPIGGDDKQSLVPVLVSSAFSDSTAANTHAQTEWNVYSSAAACEAGGIGDVYALTSVSELTSTQVPAGTLLGGTPYYWSVVYSNDFGNPSLPALCDSFTTIQTVPRAVIALPPVEMIANTAVDTGLNMNNYFVDDEGEVLTYTVSVAEHAVVGTIDAHGVLHFAAGNDWSGDTLVTVTACDTDGECVSAPLQLTVQPVKKEGQKDEPEEDEDEDEDDIKEETKEETEQKTDTDNGSGDSNDSNDDKNNNTEDNTEKDNSEEETENETITAIDDTTDTTDDTTAGVDGEESATGTPTATDATTVTTSSDESTTEQLAVTGDDNRWALLLGLALSMTSIAGFIYARKRYARTVTIQLV